MTTLAHYNLKQGRGPAIRPGLTHLLDAAAPVALGLLEVNGNRRALRAWRRGLYRQITGTGWEGRSTALLIRKGIRVHASGTITVRTPWRGPKGRVHTGRVFPWARIDLDGREVTVVVVHMPWNPRRNPAAYRACHRALRRFARTHPGPIVLMGDWNQGPETPGPGPRRLVRQIDGRIVRTGAHVDYAVTRGLRLTGDTGQRWGSDHPQTIYTLKETR